MHRAKILLTAITFFAHNAVFGFEWRQFESLTNKEDYKATQALIDSEKADNSEKKLAKALLAILESRQSHMAVVTHPPNQKGSAGYIGSKTYFEPKKYAEGIESLSKFIAENPDRLDARNAQLQIYLMADDFEAYEKSVHNFLDRDSKNSHKWYVQNQKAAEHNEHIAIGNVQRTLSSLFERDDPRAYAVIKAVGQIMIKFFPRHIYGHNNVAVYHLLRDEFQLAVAPLETAHKIDPSDEQVTRNLAYSYEKTGKTPLAKSIYKDLVRTGSDDAKEWAQSRLKGLK